ncbi:hypothetical protein COLO4_35936 [Corchorus olitorius]|uniref:Endonuclease/exonuclease/phosphatase n=1 Tax=Corchorus olitorius TaxID=93759 RepID=A0A1R3GBV0_9ROSI|nr:hypothetical protein COLO4_35936 [Corchorus olitorius]
MGDFNQVLKQSDKLSMTNNSLRGAEAFRECLNQCSLSEVKAKGLHFTWSNRRGEDQLTWERLDRAFFQLQLVIDEAWHEQTQGSAAFTLARKIQTTKERLKEWNRNHFGNLSKRKRQLEEELARIQQHIDIPENRMREEAVRKKMEEVMEQEQLMWMQKSRANWYIQGERNTKFFHLTTKKRRARNIITSIKRPDGQITEDAKEIEETFLGKFKEIYCAQDNVDIVQMRAFLQGLGFPKITEKNLAQLNAPFRQEEVKKAIFQMNPFKAPGYDGKPAAFFQKYWNIVGNLTTEAILNFLSTGERLPEFVSRFGIGVVSVDDKSAHKGNGAQAADGDGFTDAAAGSDIDGVELELIETEEVSVTLGKI